MECLPYFTENTVFPEIIRACICLLESVSNVLDQITTTEEIG